jgi:mRNA interferase MazF
MGRYARGDVVLAPVPFEEWRGAKIRPAVVVSATENGELCVCPVSSRPPSDAPSLPIGLDDFVTGGLDLFSESFVLTVKAGRLRAADVIALKGRLTAETVDAIDAQMRFPREPSAPKDPRHRFSSRR